MPPLARAFYRTRQVAHALKPRLDDGGLEWARSFLNAGEARLFFAMQRRDQRHALEVAGRLRAQGIDDDDLLKAALLHDCGKGAVPVWLRIAKVVSPAFVRDGGNETSTGWRSAAYRLTHHAEIGARLVRDAGSSEAVASLIRGHVPAGDEGRLALLMAADDAS
jgi:predicted HD phosphohydrolase